MKWSDVVERGRRGVDGSTKGALKITQDCGGLGGGVHV